MLEETARQVRTDIIDMIREAGSGHPGGSLSAVEIMVELFFREMRLDPGEPGWDGRDRFILSKGHAAPALYAVMAARGLLPRGELGTLRQPGSRLQGHPDMRALPGLDASTGSLGQGFAVAVGLARGLGMRGSGSRVYVLAGDGELQEGLVWEAAASAAHAGLANLVAVVDRNGLQLDGPTACIKDLEPLHARWTAWGWHCVPADGHSFPSLRTALEECRAARRPSVIIARTVKGRGVSFMEGECSWHGRCPGPEEHRRALGELREC